MPPAESVTMLPPAETSPRHRARMAGLLYVLMLLSGGVETFARRGLVVTGDAAATAANIALHQSAYIVGFAGDVLVVAFYVAIVPLLYSVLAPVNRSVARVAAAVGLVACAIQGVACSYLLAPLAIAAAAPVLGVFSAAQEQALAYLFLKLYSQVYGVALVFFGFFGVLTGFLVVRSLFLPRLLGWLMMLAGLCWLVFLAPPFAVRYFPFVMATAVGELLLFLWLLVKGVDEERWREQAASSSSDATPH